MYCLFNPSTSTFVGFSVQNSCSRRTDHMVIVRRILCRVGHKTLTQSISQMVFRCFFSSSSSGSGTSGAGCVTGQPTNSVKTEGKREQCHQPVSWPHPSFIYHHSHFTALFPWPPGWAGARRELLDFIVQGKIDRCRHTDHPAWHHSIRTNPVSYTHLTLPTIYSV